jgi:hypothetical protein
MRITTLRGTYISCNKFEDENGKVYQVFPYGKLIDTFEHLFPLKCFIQLEDGYIVKNIVIDK